MRHLIGLVLGIVLTPLLAAGPVWSYQRAAGLAGTARSFEDLRPDVLPAIAVMAAIGLVLGLVLAARWVSPLASLVPALAYLGVTGAYVAAPFQVLPRVPEGEPYGIGVAFLGSGVYALLGMALLIPSFLPSRWRRAAREPEGAMLDASLFEPARQHDPQAEATTVFDQPEREGYPTEPGRWDDTATRPLRGGVARPRGTRQPPPSVP